MNKILKTWIHFVVIGYSGMFFSANGFSQGVNYDHLSHRIFIDTLRAGNHDPSGTNQYYFTHTLTAFRNTKEDLETEIAQRKKLERAAVSFAEVTQNALTLWHAPEVNPEKALFVEIKGDAIRALVVEAMREFKVREDETAVMVAIKLFERNKRYYFFGEDTLVGATKYFPLPSSKLQAPSRTNLKLSIVDDKGTDVVLKIKYDEPISNQKPSESVTATPSPTASMNVNQNPEATQSATEKK